MLGEVQTVNLMTGHVLPVFLDGEEAQSMHQSHTQKAGGWPNPPQSASKPWMLNLGCVVWMPKQAKKASKKLCFDVF